MSQANRIYVALLNGKPWPPPGVDDTQDNRELRDQIAAEIQDMPAGSMPYVPWDYPEAGDELFG